MKILVTGANGQVGWELMQTAHESTAIIIGTVRQTLDITQQEQIDKAIAVHQPDVVVNAAAYTAVDKAEQEPVEAHRVNCEAAALLAQSCAKAEIPLIHISTDYIFNGQQSHPYCEEDAADPLNVYGLSKWKGEMAIRGLWDKHIILRVSGVFGAHGNNFVKTILRLASEREELRVVNDQLICPTPAAAIARAIRACCQQLDLKLWGTYHYCSSEAVSWYHFAEAIIQQAATYHKFKLKKLYPISSAEYKTLAMRPAYSVLDCHKIQSLLKITLPSWREELLH